MKNIFITGSIPISAMLIVRNMDSCTVCSLQKFTGLQKHELAGKHIEALAFFRDAPIPLIFDGLLNWCTGAPSVREVIPIESLRRLAERIVVGINKQDTPTSSICSMHARSRLALYRPGWAFVNCVTLDHDNTAHHEFIRRIVMVWYHNERDFYRSNNNEH